MENTAVLFNEAGVRLGEVRVSDRDHVLQFGGGIFYRSGTGAILDDGGWGASFDQTAIRVMSRLDRFEPRISTVARVRS